MRTKVVSIVAVIVLYISAFIWSWVNVPSFEPVTTPIDGLAFMIIYILTMLGVLFCLYHTIEWLLNK